VALSQLYFTTQNGKRGSSSLKVSQILLDFLLGVYGICVGMTGVLIKDRFFFSQLEWQRGLQCRVLQGISLFHFLVAPWQDLINDIFLHRKICTANVTDERSVFTALSVAIWLVGCLLTLSFIVGLNEKTDRFCFALFPNEDQPKIASHIAIVISTSLALVASVCTHAVTIRLFRVSRQRSKRQEFTRHEKQYIRTGVINVFFTTILVVCMAVSAFKSNTMNVHARGLVIPFAFTLRALFSSANRGLAISTRLKKSYKNLYVKKRPV
jgi:hypothetical protein